MLNIERLARTCVLESPSYKMRSATGSPSTGIVRSLVRLDRNENRLSAPLTTRAALERAVVDDDLGSYPDPDASLVRAGVANHFSVSPNDVVVTNGSIEVIKLVLTAFVDPGDAVCTLDPSYELYTVLTRVAGGRLISIPLNRRWEVDPLAIISAVNAVAAKVLLLCNPNNPTGKCLSREQVQDICDHTQDTVVVVDEAYADFARWSVVDMVHSTANLLVVRSLSKSAGLAALRIGYSISNRGIADVLQKVRIPCCVNYLAQVAASTVLDNWAIVEGMTREVVGEREFLRTELNNVGGVFAHSSDANFILIELLDERQSVSNVAARLLESGFLVRRFDHPRLERCFRVSPGTHLENVQFVETVRSIAEGYQP